MHLGVELHLHSDYLSAYTAQYPGVPTCRARKHLQACWGGLSFCCKLLQEVMLHCLDHLRCFYYLSWWQVMLQTVIDAECGAEATGFVE